jgi:uncharacterized protein UPF0175
MGSRPLLSGRFQAVFVATTSRARRTVSLRSRAACLIVSHTAEHSDSLFRAFRRRTGYNRKEKAMEITVDIPAPLFGQPVEELATRARLLLIIDEVRAGRLTRAGAARAIGMTLDDFMIEAGHHGLYAIEHDVDDFKRELRAIPKNKR